MTTACVYSTSAFWIAGDWSAAFDRCPNACHTVKGWRLTVSKQDDFSKWFNNSFLDYCNISSIYTERYSRIPLCSSACNWKVCNSVFSNNYTHWIHVVSWVYRNYLLSFADVCRSSHVQCMPEHKQHKNTGTQSNINKTPCGLAVRPAVWLSTCEQKVDRTLDLMSFHGNITDLNKCKIQNVDYNYNCHKVTSLNLSC